MVPRLLKPPIRASIRASLFSPAHFGKHPLHCLFRRDTATAVRWLLPDAIDPLLTRRLMESTGLPPWAAELLIRRGFSDPADAQIFLDPKLRTLSDPFLLPSMAAAVDRLLIAIKKRERIVLYGDYDVDGVTSLTLLTRVLRAYGADVATFLPHRVDEGYGLSADGISRCVEQHQPQLLVAVDCGTTSVDEIAQLRTSGIDTIILDHHEPKEELPKAVALVNPKLGSDFRYLCSAGICFKVAHALAKRQPPPNFDLKDVLDLVAIGTIADIVPLVQENRIFARAGLVRLEQTKWLGVKALIEASSLTAPFSATDVGFGLGPRLNAAGRLTSAEASLELLLTADPTRAHLLAMQLDQQNRERRTVEDEVLVKAEAQLLNVCPPHEHAAIVVGALGWHPGVVGIVASRLQRRYHRPTVVVGFDPMGIGKGSGRSIEGLCLVTALGRCSDHLDRFGGHEMAAGLTMRHELFDSFRQAFALAAREMLTNDQLTPRLRLDGELRFNDINLRLLQQHDQLQPFGMENRQPLFFSRQVSCVGEPRVMKEKHYSFLLRQGRADCRAVWWNSTEIPLPAPPWDVAFTVRRNEWKGNVSVQLEIADVRTSIG
jgi:single-stranded-DNA-specific exonuclease